MLSRKLSSFIAISLASTAYTAATDGRSPLLEDFDALGAWFDGVASITNASRPANADQAKNTSIAIVGAGITGLATALMLDSVGLHNWELLEADGRVGGRLRTVFVGGTQEFAEMGAMRLPWRAKYNNGSEVVEYSDHAMTFQLIDWLNDMNRNTSADLRIDLIPWIQHSPNELLAYNTGRLPDGSVPTRAEIAANASLGKPAPLNTQEYKDIKAKMNAILLNATTIKAIQRDVWRVHGQVMAQGLDEISQQSMMRNVWNASMDVTDAVRTNTDYDIFWDEMHHNSNLGLDGSASALGETEWKCIDRGFSRIAAAAVSHVRDRLRLNTQVRRIEALHDDHGNVTGTRLSWIQPAAADSNITTLEAQPGQSKDYDYTMLTVPFPVTRMMSLPKFSSVKTRAMSERGLKFKDACKVALLFRSRFWEQGARPIFGGYSVPSDPAVGALYYPQNNLNETGRPGVILSYRGGDWSSRFSSLSDAEHVAMVLDSIADLHGEAVRDLYTGEYERLCWLREPHIATSWTRPEVQQHRLYIPEYHRTEQNVIVMGEHTAPTHAWISSSLHSAVRGAVQLLLELGLVDEAKKLNQRWMGRWIQV